MYFILYVRLCLLTSFHLLSFILFITEITIWQKPKYRKYICQCFCLVFTLQTMTAEPAKRICLLYNNKTPIICTVYNQTYNKGSLYEKEDISRQFYHMEVDIWEAPPQKFTIDSDCFESKRKISSCTWLKF